MIELTDEHRTRLAELFPDHAGGNMGAAILDGCMGRALANAENPVVGVLELPDVRAAILGGDLSHPSVGEYVKNLSGIWNLFAPTDEFRQWTETIHKGKWVELDRFAFSSENLKIEYLQSLKTNLPSGFQVRKIDLDLATQLAEDKENEYANHHGINFESPEDFVNRGIGYCICEGDVIACVASSFTISNTGIEIQIDTKRSYRGNGLATVAAAYLIVDCLEKNLDAGWDAASEISAKLAEKLGYTPHGTYQVTIFTDSRALVMLRNVVQVIKRVFGIKRLIA